MNFKGIYTEEINVEIQEKALNCNFIATILLLLVGAYADVARRSGEQVVVRRLPLGTL